MKLRDFICGMEVETDTASITFEYQDEIYYFCDIDCKQMFALDPEKYIQLVEEKQSSERI